LTSRRTLDYNRFFVPRTISREVDVRVIATRINVRRTDPLLDRVFV